MAENWTARAAELGFSAAAWVDTKDIPFEPAFLQCCEENLCGKYGANYACPPACGTPYEMIARIRAGSRALVLQTLWEIDNPMDGTKTKPAKREHNRMERALLAEMQEAHPETFMVGSSCCDLCPRCAMVDGKPCLMPEKKFSCMSAYCVFVRKLAELCGMDYDCGRGLIAFFGLCVLP